VIETRFARLYKPRWHNTSLKRSQHGLFSLTRKDDCVAFILVLDFYERLLEERGASVDDVAPIRFEMSELFAHAKERLARTARAAAADGDDAASARGASAPSPGAQPDTMDDDGIRRLFRDLVPQLLRCRFLREVPREREDASDGDALGSERMLYECLPGLHAYDVRALDEAVLQSVLLGKPSSEGTEP
jgi:hypothetical protein